MNNFCNYLKISNNVSYTYLDKGFLIHPV